MPERLHYFSPGKLLAQNGQSMQKPFPPQLAVVKSHLDCQPIGNGGSGASDSISKMQNPYPSTVEDMMDCRIFDGIWRVAPGLSSEQVLEKLDTGKMRVQSPRGWKFRESPFPEAQGFMQKAAWSAGVHEKFGCNGQLMSISLPGQVYLVAMIGDSP
jgi:hypothetical protein